MDFFQTLVIKSVRGSNSSPLDHTVTFTVDGEPYEVAHVKDGNTVNRPTLSQKENTLLSSWIVDEKPIDFPYTPTKHVDAEARFSSALYKIYNKLGYSIEQYPKCIIQVNSNKYVSRVIFGKSFTIYRSSGYYYCKGFDVALTLDSKTEDIYDIDKVCDTIINNSASTLTNSSVQVSVDSANAVFYTNFDLTKLYNRSYILI